MRIFHLSDLHIGRQLNYYNLFENQREILNQIIEKIKEYQPEVVMISGDIYDKSMPSGEAYNLFDRFLNQLAELEPNVTTFIIAGNHDSADRLKYASSFLEKHSIYISVYPPRSEDEYLKNMRLEDEFGEVRFYLLPFTKPGHVRHLFEEGVVTSYHSAVKSIVDREDIDYSKRNILLSHQFYVAGNIKPEGCESEQVYISVGGLDSVDISVVEKFDYVALGHLHGKQSVGHSHIRYCGTPLKYSVSEEKHKKSITMLTIKDKDDEVLIEEIPLIATQNVRKEKGLLSEIISRATEENRHDFLSITITDEVDPFKPKEKLEEFYDNILELKVENTRTQTKVDGTLGVASVLEPFDAFREFFKEMQQCDMSEAEENIMASIIASSREAE